jgi:hypothetical protein
MDLDHAVGVEHGGIALTELDRHVAQVDIGEGAEQRTQSRHRFHHSAGSPDEHRAVATGGHDHAQARPDLRQVSAGHRGEAVVLGGIAQHLVETGEDGGRGLPLRSDDPDDEPDPRFPSMRPGNFDEQHPTPPPQA